MMIASRKTGATAAAMLCLLFLSTGAQSQIHNMNAPMGTPQSQYPGKMIAHKMYPGTMFMYHLLDMSERNTLMKGMEGMDMPGLSKSPDITNHLIVYLFDADGKILSGKVGFQFTGPDGADSKTLTMGMGGGYGADVSLKKKGIYKILTKAVIGDKTIIDDITYEVK